MKKPIYVRIKNLKKVVRTLLQMGLLAFLAWVLMSSTLLSGSYQTWQDQNIAQGERGFIALSYFGVSREGGGTLIGSAQLRKQLTALHAAGYVTITQQDILDFYAQGKPLPEKALFLIFEDGRRESAVLAQSVLEQFNYKATMLSYASHLEGRSQQYLSPQDLKTLRDSGYWELGANGYRLSYINVFDRQGNYLDELTTEEYVHVSPYIQRRYDHYLMDYLRDEYGVPMETAQQMRNRIATDYALMQSVYEEKIGGLPAMYTIMHANTGQYATNAAASQENERWLTDMFSINFNRDLQCDNGADTNLYDLTRLSAKSYWSVNHLLMRIAQETGRTFEFVQGEPDLAKRWQVYSGAAEHSGEEILVTSEPAGTGLIRLEGSEATPEFFLSTTFAGNKLGTQSVDVWMDASGERYVAVEIKNNIFSVYQQMPEGTLPMVTLDLDVHDGVVYQTWEAYRQEAMEKEIEIKGLQSYKMARSKDIARRLARAKADASLANLQPYIPAILANDAGKRLVEITVNAGLLSVSIDGKPAVEALRLPEDAKSGIALRSAWSEYGTEERKAADDVYDGVFRGLTIAQLGLGDTRETVFDNRLQGVDRLLQEAQRVWSEIVKWSTTML